MINHWATAAFAFLISIITAAQSFATDSTETAAVFSEARLVSLREASSQGSATAMVELAGIYLNGSGVKRDPERAADLYHRAAMLGDADATFHLGNMYLLGDGIPQNDEQAFRLFEKAAGQGHPLAIQNYETLKRLAEPESEPPPEIDNAEEVSLDELRAIEIARRHGIVIDFSGMADPTLSGHAPVADFEDSARNADLNPLISDSPELIEEDFLLAEQLYYGDGVARDEAKAITLYRRAARAGHKQAKSRLLAIYAAAGIKPPLCAGVESNDEICF
ncbi:MAG: tetratricopeptide repeat protein [Gammaproteobacteria bacterium]